LNKDGADFVCIEPWQSHADFVDEIEGFENKKDIILLKPESDWVKSFEIEFCLS
jgi:galactose mutarotase-like enzyme